MKNLFFITLLLASFTAFAASTIETNTYDSTIESKNPVAMAVKNAKDTTALQSTFPEITWLSNAITDTIKIENFDTNGNYSIFIAVKGGNGDLSAIDVSNCTSDDRKIKVTVASAITCPLVVGRPVIFSSDGKGRNGNATGVYQINVR